MAAMFGKKKVQSFLFMFLLQGRWVSVASFSEESDTVRRPIDHSSLRQPEPQVTYNF